MKAVHKFKSLVWNGRPKPMQIRLGSNIRTTEQGLTGNEEGDHSLKRSQSVDVDDRRAVESALVAEGVHRPITPIMKDSMPLVDRMDSTVAVESSPSNHGSRNQSHDAGHRHHLDSQSPPLPSASKQHTKHSEDTHREKGHAHDPMDEEPLFLGIGTGKHNGDSTATSIAESPTAAEFSIYDTAYQQEVERIREAQGHKATVYLTRRVDSKKEYQMDANMVDLPKSEDVKGHAHGGFMHLVEKAREQGKEKFNDNKEETSDKSEPQKEKMKVNEHESVEGKNAMSQRDADTPKKKQEISAGNPPSPVEIKSRSKKLSELVDRAQEGLKKRGKEGNVMVSGLVQRVSAMGRKNTGGSAGADG